MVFNQRDWQQQMLQMQMIRAAEKAQRDMDAKRIEEGWRLEQMARENAAREHNAFVRLLVDAMRPVIRQELEAIMATKTIGKVKLTSHKTGKTTFSPIAKMPVSKKIGAKAKADRVEKGLRANRKGAK